MLRGSVIVVAALGPCCSHCRFGLFAAVLTATPIPDILPKAYPNGIIGVASVVKPPPVIDLFRVFAKDPPTNRRLPLHLCRTNDRGEERPFVVTAVGRCPVLLHIEHWALALVADICGFEITGGPVSRFPTTTTASLEELVGGVEVGTPVLLLWRVVGSDGIPVQVFEPSEGSGTEVRRDPKLRDPPMPVHVLQLPGNCAWSCRRHFGRCPCWRCPFHPPFWWVVPVFFRIVEGLPLYPRSELASPRARCAVRVMVSRFLPRPVVVCWAVR